MSQHKFIETVDQILTHAKKKNIIHHFTQDNKLQKNLITINERKLVNFGSCSYLGLEFEESVKQAGKDAIDNYGTQFSSSRAYVSPKFYKTLEEKLSTIFGSPTIVTPTTTLGHIAAIPILIGPNDAVILDHQVHNSIQTAVNLVKARKTHVELVRHNRMDLLEQRIIELKSKHDKIWYMADGIYSMYGDLTPLDEIYALLDKYKEFNFYVDDAHGMSCFGDKGQGYVLSNHKIHDRMIVATSFAKGFATGGGALILPNEEIASLIRNCGGPLITSGPMQPSALGAANRVADMHLSKEILRYQSDLKENITYTNLLLDKFGLPNLAEKKTPIFFIAVSLPKIAYKLIDKLKDDGFFLNLGIFPAVPIKNTGVRFTITSLHTFSQIHDMVASMARHFFEILKEEDYPLEQIYKAFKMKSPEIEKFDLKVQSLIKHSSLKTTTTKTIEQIDENEWNNTFKNHGTFDHQNLHLIEKSFTNNDLPENNWEFDYIIVKDPNDKIVLATFSTISISKDDMFADSEISQEIEDTRIDSPYFMTSKTLSLGHPVSEGNHLYLDEKSEYWKESLDILVDHLSKIQENSDVSITILRDLDGNNEKLDHYMVENGFFKTAMPEKFKINEITWQNDEDYYQTLSNNNKRQYRKNVLRNQDKFEFKIHESYCDKTTSEAYELYSNVKDKSLSINTFKLPKKLIKNLCLDGNWEILSLYLKSNSESQLDKKPVAIAICHKGATKYSFLLAGLDYKYNTKHSCYRQLLAKIVSRGTELGFKEINMGYTSDIEKQRFGAKAHSSCAYMQVNDNYNMEALGAMAINKKREDGIIERRVLPV